MFSFYSSQRIEHFQKIKGLDKKKPSTFNGIPPKILVEIYDIISPFITKMFNDSNLNMIFQMRLN